MTVNKRMNSEHARVRRLSSSLCPQISHNLANWTADTGMHRNTNMHISEGPGIFKAYLIVLIMLLLINSVLSILYVISL